LQRFANLCVFKTRQVLKKKKDKTYRVWLSVGGYFAVVNQTITPQFFPTLTVLFRKRMIISDVIFGSSTTKLHPCGKPEGRHMPLLIQRLVYLYGIITGFRMYYIIYNCRLCLSRYFPVLCI